MLTENEVLLQLGMRFQLGVLRYSDIKVKEINTHKHIFNRSLQHVKTEILLTC